jgi:hypothetical protein
MFSKIIRLGVALSGAVILSSCGGSSGQTLTQTSTPEGLFISMTGKPGKVPTVTFTNTVSSAALQASCTQNVLVFVESTGAFYSFAFTEAGTDTAHPIAPDNLVSASSGTFSFSGGAMSSGNVLEVTPPNVIDAFLSGSSTTPNPASPHGVDCGIAISSSVDVFNGVTQVNNETTSPTFVGGYDTGINLAGTFTYPLAIDAAGDSKSTFFNINYDADYQSVQSLATLAGSYTGTVSTSQFSEAATFTFGPASVAANSGNQYGVGIVTGTGTGGCTYTGTVSPLYKGNGYSMSVTAGGSPCHLPGTQFTGLVYFRQSSGYLYSFAPNPARNDGLIFSGSRN